MEIEELYSKLIEYLKLYDLEYLEKLVLKTKEYNLKVLTELKTRIRYF